MNPSSGTRILNIIAQLGIALGIVIQIATGVEGYPTIPPGAVIAVVVAVLLAVVRWRYVVVLGLLLPVWMAIGAVADHGTRDRLGDPGEVGPFLGTLIQVIAVAVGIVTGLVLTVAAFRSTRHADDRSRLGR